MRTALIFLPLLALSACSFDSELVIPCTFDTKEHLSSTEEIDIIQNGFRIGSVLHIAQVSAASLPRIQGIIKLPKRKCYSLSTKFALYKPNKNKEHYVVISSYTDSEDRCLTANDTVVIRTFKPVSLPLDSISVKLIDSVITRIKHK